VVTAHTSLGSPGNPWADAAKPQLLDDAVVSEIAKKHNKNSAQVHNTSSITPQKHPLTLSTTSKVLLRWAVQRGYVVIPKSITPERIVANTQIFDFELTTEDMDHITGLNRDYRYTHSLTLLCLLIFYSYINKIQSPLHSLAWSRPVSR